MRLAGSAAIVGIAELPAERKPTRPELFTLDQYAQLARMVLDDAGLPAGVVNGLISHGLAESDMFVPATLSEYLGLPIDFGERVDLGGATSAANGSRSPRDSAIEHWLSKLQPSSSANTSTHLRTTRPVRSPK